MATSTSVEMNWLPLPKRKGCPVGLKNLGNSCYLNSVLQCLTYTPPLANFCLLSNHSSSCASANGNTICAFCLLEKRIFRSLTIDSTSDSPMRIYNCLSLFAKHFRQGWQEDAHEFLRNVIDACNSVCIKLHKLLAVTKMRTRQDAQKKSKEEPHTVVKEIFGGVLQSQVKCLSCQSESNKLDDIMDLSLDILKIASLKDAMCWYFQPDILDGNNKYRCEKCKKLTPARKQMSVFQAPNVLVIQLKRFENIHGGKIDRHIGFEERLDLHGYMCKGSQDQKPEYLLYGLIVHAGYSQDSGHYYAYVKDINGKWFCCNDAHVTLVTSKAVLAEKAYMLFYVRQTEKSAPKCSETHLNNKKTLQIKEATSKSQESVTERNRTVEKCTSMNGKTLSSSSTPQTNVSTTKWQGVAVNQNGSVEKYSTLNVSSCSADQGQGVQQVRFSIIKPTSNGQNRKLTNGTAGVSSSSSIGTRSYSNGNHILSNGNSSHRDFGEKREEGSVKTSDVSAMSNQEQEQDQGSKIFLNGNHNYSSNIIKVEPKLEAENKVSESLPPIAGNKRKDHDEVDTAAGCNGQLELSRQMGHRESKIFPMEDATIEEIKPWLASDTRDWLERTGWRDMVRNSFRLIKKARLEQETDVSKENLSVAFQCAYNSLRQKVPIEVKEHLYEQLQAHFATQMWKKSQG